MRQLIYMLFALVIFVSCKKNGNNTVSESSPNYPKIHYSSTDHNVGAPISLLFQNGMYSLFYKEFKLDKKEICPTYLTTSKDLIHWQTAQQVAFCKKDLNILNRTVVLNSQKSDPQKALASLLVVDPDKNEENNNCYFKLSYSDNQGKIWTESEDKIEFPIKIKNDFNPSVIWVENHKKWIMSVVDDQAVKIFSSIDLKKWKFESSIDKELQYTANIWLKATLLPLNNGDNWAMLVDQEFVNPRDGSSIQYFIGTFDGKSFSAPVSSKSHWLDYGKDNIYNVVCAGLPANANPTVIGWKNNIDYTMIGSMKPFWGSFTIPRTLMLDEYSGEKVLASQLVRSLSLIESKSISLHDLDVTENLDISKRITIPLTPSVITIKFKTSEKTRLTFPARYGVQFENDEFEKLIIGYDAFKEWYFVDRMNFLNVNENSQFKGMDVMPSYNSDSVMTIKMIVDDSSIELFTTNGKQVMTDNFTTGSKLNKISLFAENGIIKVDELTIQSLKSIWNRKE